ncbi:MAG: TolC family protein [Acidobacteria bacterium]|nr:TolC family protein [Acidobacteriota bacterium]
MIARLVLMAAAAAVASYAQMPRGPLLLEDILSATEASYPALLAAIQERAMAEGKALSAEGAFDTKLTAKAGTNQLGYYKNRTAGAQVEQPLADWGGELFGGYKRGQGNFGPWEQDVWTLSGGELSGGIRLPLFRDRETDVRRTDLLTARLGVDLAGASVEKQRLKMLETASKVYWDWVSAARKLQVAEALLELAEARIRQVEEQVELGSIAAIEIADNKRAVLERRAAVVSAGRELQNATLELSMFYRDGAGEPQMAHREQAPEFPEPRMIETHTLSTDLTSAIERRPEIVATLVEVDQSSAALRLAQNQLLPSVDFEAKYGQDSGVGSITKRGPELIAGIKVTTPFQRRKSKGQIALAEAKLAQLGQKLRFAQNRIEVEVRDAASALDAAVQRLELARAELEVAQLLAEAERERFDLGDSTLFVVNLREIATAGARLKVVSSLADCHKAVASYRAAIAGF